MNTYDSIIRLLDFYKATYEVTEDVDGYTDEIFVEQISWTFGSYENFEEELHSAGDVEIVQDRFVRDAAVVYILPN